MRTRFAVNVVSLSPNVESRIGSPSYQISFLSHFLLHPQR